MNPSAAPPDLAAAMLAVRRYGCASRRDLGALATMLVLEDALANGGSTIHLAVEADNETARSLYERLGFAVVGEPAPDLLLR